MLNVVMLSVIILSVAFFIVMLSVIMLTVAFFIVMLSVIFPESHYVEYRYAECRFAVCESVCHFCVILKLWSKMSGMEVFFKD
jgi:hypothetical protein